MYVVDLRRVGKEDVRIAGGKGANLGELLRLGFPVPPGFVVTSRAYWDFLDKSGLRDRIFDLLRNLNVEDTKSLEETSEKIREMIVGAEVPGEIRAEVVRAYRKLGERNLGGMITRELPFVIVRSSATAEDLPEASFAGQQATIFNVRGDEELIKAVKECWASLFTARAIYYREKQGFPHEKVGIAVVVQRMLDSEVAGVLFTADPVTGEPKIIIEAAYGQGDAVVSGAVTPDRYVVDKETLRILEKNVVEQERMMVRDPSGGLVWKEVDPRRRKEQKLSDSKIRELALLGKRIEEHYGWPQDIEWAVEKGEIYIVQSRAVTTIRKEEKEEKGRERVEEGEVLVRGIPASPGTATGPVKIVLDLKDLDKVEKGDILVTTMTTPDMVPAMRKAGAIVTDEGGLTCHAAIVSRELGIPAVVGTGNATKVLKEGMVVTVDAHRGIVYRGETKVEVKRRERARYLPTATMVKVNVAFPEAAERAAATGADGVGLLRAEHMITEFGIHPAEYIRRGEAEKLTENVYRGVKRVAEAFYPKPVWYRTFDARTDEFRHLEGGDREPKEDNPMLGVHGIRRSIMEPEILEAELEGIARLVDEGYDNIGVMFPFVSYPWEFLEARSVGEEIGLDVEYGIMVETPAAALTIEDFLEEGVDFISFGTNDLTQLTLGVDRNNELLKDLWSEKHPAVLRLIQEVIDAARDYGVETSVCGQAGSDPDFVRILVHMGIDSVSANIDAVERIREVVHREERRILLEAARGRLEE